MGPSSGMQGQVLHAMLPAVYCESAVFLSALLGELHLANGLCHHTDAILFILN